MLHFLNNLLKNKILLSVLAFWGCCQLSFGQFIAGPFNVDTNSTHSYTYQDGTTYSSVKWQVVGATNLTMPIQSGSVFNIQVQFPSTAGSATISIKYGRIILATHNVTINAVTPPPSPPPLPDGTLNSDQNYILNIAPTEPTTDVSTLPNADKLETVTYFDGLGRAKQNIGIRAGGYGEDIITHIDYDGLGRQVKDYLPYPDANAIGTYRTDALSPTKNYYKTTYADDFSGILEANINPYSEKDLETSPLSRVLKQAAPGDDWKLGSGHEIEFDYLTNSSTEVKYFSVTLSSANNTYTPVLAGGTTYYSAKKLYKTIAKDENQSGTTKNHTIEEFKNDQGQVLLKRTYTDSDLNNDGDTNDAGESQIAHDTYYIYDDYGNLSYVLPPKMDATAETLANINLKLNDLAYQYVYDSQHRLVEKKIPGKGWESIVYNKLNQPVLTQDANLDEDDIWLFTKYDVFGRVAYTGKMSSGAKRNNLQTTVDSETTHYETRSGSSTTIDGKTVFYNNVAYPTSNMSDLHTINYYDTYIDLPSPLTATVTTSYGLTSSTKTKGLPTVNKVSVLGTYDWITTVSYYDDKGRPIYVYSTNPFLGTTDIVESKLDFTGSPEEIKTTHKKTGESDIVTVEVFTYDHAGRLIKQTHTIGSGNEEVIAQHTYDGLGQMISKKVGNTTSTPLQTVDYTYNVRGWLKEINEVATLGTKLFAFGINYNTIEHNGTKLYNGNIAETEWKTSNDNSLRWYKYSYDALNRLTSAEDDIDRYSLSRVTYDQNGNINSLIRKGHIVSNPVSTNSSHFNTMDNLSYNYNDGNELLNVTDSTTETFGFDDGNLTGTDYIYDNNGNMIEDKNNRITISYNHLNLPATVTTEVGIPNEGGTMAYAYDANGVKLKKYVTHIYSHQKSTIYAGNYIYEINVGVVSLKFFSHSEGYVDASGSGYEYVYQYKDHLGNIRLNYKNTGTTSSPTLQIQEENNYYPFGLKHKGYNGVVNSEHSWKYNGVELNESLDLNLYEMDFRQYDPAIARFTSIDPVTHFSNSTYTAFDNNPVFWADPSGANSQPIYQNGRYIINGEEVSFTTAMASVGLNANGSKMPPSGVATKYDSSRTILVETHLVFYGSAADKNIANAIQEETSKQYNSAGSNKYGVPATIMVNNTEYAVIFSITSEVVSETEAINMARNNSDAKINFIRIEPGGKPSDRSFMRGSNSGVWYLSDGLGTSSTGPHELGHGYGLPHSNNDQRGNGIPDIMVARGALVDPQFQWNPNANPGSYGGTINPINRQVLQSNISLIFKNITFNKNGKANIGRTDNIIYDKNGNQK